MRYFGRQVKKARLARGWTIREAGRALGFDNAHVSRVESGIRPPTDAFARACDRAWPEHDGWFYDFFTEARGWAVTPPWFRSWLPIEVTAADLRVFESQAVPGLLQSEQYARAVLSDAPGLARDHLEERVADQLARQCLLARDDLAAWFLVGEAALRTLAGSPAVMADQMAHLLAASQLPAVTIQVVPPGHAHGAASGAFAVATGGAQVATAVGDMVFEDAATVRRLGRRWDMIRSEACTATESQALIRRIGDEYRRRGAGDHPVLAKLVPLRGRDLRGPTRRPVGSRPPTRRQRSRSHAGPTNGRAPSPLRGG